VVPVTRSAEGLPIGVQDRGAAWEEDLVLQVAAAIEARVGWVSGSAVEASGFWWRRRCQSEQEPPLKPKEGLNGYPPMVIRWLSMADLRGSMTAIIGQRFASQPEAGNGEFGIVPAPPEAFVLSATGDVPGCFGSFTTFSPCPRYSLGNGRLLCCLAH